MHQGATDQERQLWRCVVEIHFPVIQRTPHVVDGRRKQPRGFGPIARGGNPILAPTKLSRFTFLAGGVRQEASGSCESSQSRVGLREKHDWLGVQSQLPRYGVGP